MTQSLLIGSFVKFYNKDLFFNITGSPLDPNKILEYKPLPFEEILLQRRRKKSCKNWPNPKSCDVLIYTRSLFTLHLTACSWWWKKKGMYSLTKMYIKIFFDGFFIKIIGLLSEVLVYTRILLLLWSRKDIVDNT